MNLKHWIYGMGRCGYTEADRAAIRRMRKQIGGVFLAFLGLNQVMSVTHRGAVGAGAAVLAGLCFAALLVMSMMLALRAGDEAMRQTMVEAMLWGMGITVVLASVAGYLELSMGWHVPVLMVPVCAILATSVAKVVLFRQRSGPSVEPA